MLHRRLPFLVSHDRARPARRRVCPSGLGEEHRRRASRRPDLHLLGQPPGHGLELPHLRVAHPGEHGRGHHLRDRKSRRGRRFERCGPASLRAPRHNSARIDWTARKRADPRVAGLCDTMSLRTRDTYLVIADSVGANVTMDIEPGQARSRNTVHEQRAPPRPVWQRSLTSPVVGDVYVLFTSNSNDLGRLPRHDAAWRARSHFGLKRGTPGGACCSTDTAAAAASSAPCPARAARAVGHRDGRLPPDRRRRRLLRRLRGGVRPGSSWNPRRGVARRGLHGPA